MPRVRNGGTMRSMDIDTDHLPRPPDGYKYMACRHCGEPMLVGVRKRNAPGHIDCGVQVAATVQRQMAAKSGPYYDRWRASMARRFQA